jgi:protease I
MKRAVMLTGPGFQEQQVLYAYYRLKGEAYLVDIATEAGKPVKGSYGMPLPFPFDTTTRPLLAFDKLKVSEYDLVLCPGGYEAPERVRSDRHVKTFVKGMYEAGKVVAGIEQGIWIMIAAGVMQGRMACAAGGIKEDLLRAGARVTEREGVTVDGTLITCGFALWVEAFMKAVLSMVEHHTTDELQALSSPLAPAHRRHPIPSISQRSFFDEAPA